MTDFASYRKLDYAFADLLADLSKSWPSIDVAYVQDIVAHAEYGDALENLVAMAANNGRNFSSCQTEKLRGMCVLMGLDVCVVEAPARSPA